MPKEFMDTYGNIAHVEKVEYEGLAEDGGDTPLVTETRDFSIIYTISNTGDFNLAPEFSFEGCDAEIKKIETEKYRIALTVSGESLATLEDGAALKVKLLLYMAKQKILQSAYEIDMLYVRTSPPADPPNSEDRPSDVDPPNPDAPPGSVAPSNPGNPSGGDPSNPEEEEPALPENIVYVYVRGDNATWYDENKPDAKIGDDENNSGDEDEPFATIQRAVDEIIERNKHNEGNDGKSSYEIRIDGTLEGDKDGTYIGAQGMADFSALEKDLTLTIIGLSETATLDAGANVIIDDNGRVTVMPEGIKKPVIYAVPASGSLNLTLEKLVIKGGNVKDKNGGGIYASGAVITVRDGVTITGNNGAYGGGVFVDDSKTTFNIKDGAKITKNSATGGSGGGVYVKNSGSALTMEGGEITENIGNGVFNKGKFNMTGGTINDNTGAAHGGGVYAYSGTFTMSGSATISKNSAKYGGGVFLNSGTFTMSGDAKISDNNADSYYGGGVVVNTGKFTMSDNATISGNTTNTTGGGVYVFYQGNFNMKGGTISGNTATTNGGGVYVTNGREFTMEGGTISGNEANGTGETSGGGGVYVNNGNFTISGSVVISGNTATKDGGGVYINENGMVTMNGGEISGNEANGTGETSGGGGVYVNRGNFTISGSAVISGNTATKDGGGVYIHGNDTVIGTVTMSGGKIDGKNTANCGGGVYIKQGTLTLKNGTISGNDANTDGGGVYIASNGEFTMNGGEISNNDAKGNKTTGSDAGTAGGGGVYVYRSTVNAPKGIFTMTGGTITNNTASGSKKGNGVHVSPYAMFNMSGSAKVAQDNDNDVYLHVYPSQDKIPTIQVIGPLTAESPVATITPADYVVDRQVLSASAGADVELNQTLFNQFKLSNGYTIKFGIVDGTPYGVIGESQ